MIDKIRERIDPKYFKICLYAVVSILITAIALCILIYSGGFWGKVWALIKAVIRPIIIGGILCYLLTPIVKLIERKIFKNQGRRWERPAAVAITCFLVLAALSLIVVLVVVTVSHSIDNINIDYIKEFFGTVKGNFSNIIDALKQKIADIGIPVSKVGSIVTALVGGAKDFITGGLFGIIFAVYFLLDSNRIFSYWKKAFILTFGQKAEDRLAAFASDADRAFAGYIRGQFMDALIAGTVSAIVFIIAGVPNGGLVGVLVGLGNMIPYVGPILGYVGVAVVCLMEGSFDKLLSGEICLLIIMLLDGNVLNPKLLANSVKVHPLLVVAALIGGGALGGLLGMIVAVPVGALIKLQFDRYLQKKEDRLKGETTEVQNAE